MSYKVRKLDKNKDFTFGHGLLDYVNAHAKVEQMICTRVREIKGDWFANTNTGIDYYNLIGQRGTMPVIESQVFDVAKSTEGVLVVDSVSSVLDRKNRAATITVTGKTIYNEKFALSIGIS